MARASRSRSLNGHLHELVEKRLAESAIDLKLIKPLALKGLQPAETRALGHEFEERASLLIPYHDTAGAATGFYRVRYLEAPSGFAGQAEKPRRYAQPAKTVSGAYFPRVEAIDWQAIEKDPRRAVIITEGELKAASASAQGLPTIGLGGVYNWQSKQRGLAFLPALERFDWTARAVTLAFDSDAATNPQVVIALNRLGRALTERGALVAVASLEPLPDGRKAGLDDVIAERGLKTLIAQLDAAEPFALAHDLWELSAQVAYVRDPGLIVELSTKQRIAPSAFVNHAYSNWRTRQIVTKADGGTKETDVATAKLWLEWPARHEAARLAYAPGKPPVTEDGALNLWNGWNVRPKKGDVKPWHELLDYVFGEHGHFKRYFEQWCAYPLQHPGTKLYTAALMWGTTQGTGKTLIGYTLQRIYGSNSTEIKQEHLHSGFNDWAECKQFIVADEVSGSDRRQDADRIKSLITQRTFRINTKFIPVYELPDCVNYYFTSQHENSFYIEETDRRYFVWEFPKVPHDRAFYERYDRWYRSEEGPAALFDYLLKLDLEGFNPREAAPVTPAKLAIIGSGRSDLGSFIADLLMDPTGAFGGSELVSSAQVRALYDPEQRTKVSANGIARELRRAGAPLVNGGDPVRTRHGLLRLFALKNQKKWLKAKPAAIAAAFDHAFPFIK